MEDLSASILTRWRGKSRGILIRQYDCTKTLLLSLKVESPTSRKGSEKWGTPSLAIPDVGHPPPRPLASAPSLTKRRGAAGAAPLLSAANGYLASCPATSGSTCVPSALTASSNAGLRPKAFTIVGATCLVVATAETVWAVKLGFDTSMMTLVSSCAKPPWSPIIVALPE